MTAARRPLIAAVLAWLLMSFVTVDFDANDASTLRLVGAFVLTAVISLGFGLALRALRARVAGQRLEGDFLGPPTFLFAALFNAGVLVARLLSG